MPSFSYGHTGWSISWEETMTQRASAARSLPRVTATDRGSAAIEYGLILVAIAAVLAGVIAAFGGFMDQTFRDSRNCLENSTTPYPVCKSE
jgi:Flp pilus assembly pilin Flp